VSSKLTAMNDSATPTPAERKQQRLAAALRANLAKRKAREREAAATNLPLGEREGAVPFQASEGEGLSSEIDNADQDPHLPTR
jgi:hypothetical protein